MIIMWPYRPVLIPDQLKNQPQEQRHLDRVLLAQPAQLYPSQVGYESRIP